MIESMTGFGRMLGKIGDKKVVVDIRSLNSKQFDLNLKLPLFYKEAETSIRKLTASKLRRGKIDIQVNAESMAEQPTVHINKQLVKGYVNALGEIASECNLEQVDLISAVMRLPNIMGNEMESSKTELEDLLALTSEAMEKIIAFRKQEGDYLKSDFEQRIQSILQRLVEVKERAPIRADLIKKKLISQINDLRAEVEQDLNRMEQELFYYLEKIDITEEMVRLEGHCKLFLSELNNGVESRGKKLNFISQEIGREINTMGSKANDQSIQQMVVEMKDDLEKIKEQMLNVL